MIMIENKEKKSLPIDNQEGQQEEYQPPPAYTRNPSVRVQRAPRSPPHSPTGSRFVAPSPDQLKAHDREKMYSTTSSMSESSFVSTTVAGGSTMNMPRGTHTMLFPTDSSGSHWVNHLVMRTKHDDVKGEYYINPNLEVPDHATSLRDELKGLGGSSSCKGKGKGRKSVDASWRPSTAASRHPCNAFIEANRATVDLTLNIGGTGSWKSNKAYIDIINKYGKTFIKMLDLAQDRMLHLDVQSKRGNMEVYLPRNFTGVLHVYAKSTDITLLPRLASSIEVISAKEDEALVMITPVVGSPSGSSAPSNEFDRSPYRTNSGSAIPQWSGNYVNLVCMDAGSILVGFEGENVKEAQTGFWKTIANWFSGKDKDNS